MLKFLHNLKRTIESKRNSKNFLWKILVLIKDAAWFSYYCASKIKFNPRYQSNKPKFKHKHQKIKRQKISIRYRSKLVYNLTKRISLLRIRKIDQKLIPHVKSEIRLFVVSKNEATRLPYFFDYYLNKLGVDRIFFIDNGSSDNSLELALATEKVHVFETNEKFRYKENWIHALLDKYGVGHWCIVVDADEIFDYPHSESLSLKQFCNYLEKHNYTALKCFFLDMYPRKSINWADSVSGKNPYKRFRYFDKDFNPWLLNLMNLETFCLIRVECEKGFLIQKFYCLKSHYLIIPRIYFCTLAIMLLTGRDYLNFRE
jgi:hypothetical protein